MSTDGMVKQGRPVVHRQEAEYVVLEASGDLDLYSAPRLRAALTDLRRSSCNLVIVDMSAVDFMDSSGLGVLIGGVKWTRAAGGALVLAGAPERVLRILRVTGVVKVLPVFETLPEAVAYLDKANR